MDSNCVPVCKGYIRTITVTKSLKVQPFWRQLMMMINTTEVSGTAVGTKEDKASRVRFFG